MPIMTDTGPTPPPGSTPPPSTPQTPPPGGTLNYGTPPAETGYVGPAPTPDERTMGMLAHLLGIIGFLGPLIIWLIKRDQSPFVNDQGKEALNFHLTLLIGWVIGAALIVACIGPFIMLAVWIVGLIFSIMGALKAKEGIPYRYPFAIRMIK